MLSAILLGIIVGLMMGLTGAGGGILAIPALMYGLKLTLTEAKPVALIAVGIAALVGTFHGLRNGVVRYRAALVMALAGALSAPIGVGTAQYLSPTIITVIFAAVMILSGTRMLLSTREITTENQTLSRAYCPINQTSGRFIWKPATVIVLFSIGLIAGFLTGLLGVGGGFIIVPLLLAASNLSITAAVATSLSVITANALIAVVLTLDPAIPLSIPLWLFIGCTLIGLIIGRLLNGRIPEKSIRLGFASLSYAVASIMTLSLLQK